MRIGAVFPQAELGGDVGAVRAYGEAVEQLGFTHLLVYDHVVGADPAVHEGWDGTYDIDTTFHEPLVLFGFLAAITALELVTGILIAPQRQTVLVAKQAAEVDLLTGGRFRLGLGVGWNAVEYEALGQRFDQRGRKLTEQVELLRRLWTQRSVTFDGGFDRVTGAGIAPLPVQRPIPIWFGAASDAAYRRVGRLGDGWFPLLRPGPDLDHGLEMVAAGAAEVGRDPSSIGMEGRVIFRPSDVDAFVGRVEGWRAAGASHLTIDTMRQGFATVDDHIAGLGIVADACSLR